MRERPILICYDGSDDARRAIGAAEALVGPRRAVVLDMGPPLTAAESYAAISPGVVGADFEEMNEAYMSVFGDDPPARITVGCSALALGAGVEIDCVTVLTTDR